jgi:NAD(P)-dependent dehydrogenase (short-subunit alcohol dehydrogenase family)
MIYPHLFDLKGKIAVVTGASSGLGQGAATVLAAHGVRVVAIARREGKLNAWSQSAKGETSILIADLADRSTIADIAAEAVRPFGAPDILINAAGINTRQPADDMTDAHWDLTQNLLWCPVCGLKAGAGSLISLHSNLAVPLLMA